MKKFISGLTVLLFAVIFTVSANAAPGDLYVQVEADSGGGLDQCSILKVTPLGELSEFVSFTDILALTGLLTCDMDTTGIAIADNGDVYFSEDISNSIFKARPDGALSIFVTEAQITAVTGAGTADLNYAMVIGPDGDLYFGDRESDSVLKATIPGGAVSLVLSKAQIVAVTGNSTADLQGSIAFDCSGNLYITDTPPTGDGDMENILILNPAGILSVFVTEQEINAATGFNGTRIDSGMTFFGSLFVNDDGDCGCVLEITLNRDISVFVSKNQVTAATGNGGSDLVGGIAVNQLQDVLIGDDGNSPNDPNILKSIPDGSNVSLFVTTDELRDFYTPLGFPDPRLEGSMAIEGVKSCVISEIPTMSEWGLIAMAGVLGIIGFIAIRRRKAVA